MSVISGSDYRAIAEDYASSRTSNLAAKDGLYDAVYLIVLLNAIQPEVDLLNTFWDAYNIQLDTLESPTLYLSAVRALNQHVLTRGGYTSVDDFLSHEGQTVPQAWADLSADAGYPISAPYII